MCHCNRGHRVSLQSEVSVFMSSEVIVRQCNRRSSCSPSSRSSCINAIGGHRVHRHRGHRASLLSEVIVSIVIEVIVRHCYRRSSSSSSSRSSCVTVIGGHRVYCHRGHRCHCNRRSSCASHVIVIIAIGVKIYRRYGRELRSYIDVVIAKIGSKK